MFANRYRVIETSWTDVRNWQLGFAIIQLLSAIVITSVFAINADKGFVATLSSDTFKNGTITLKTYENELKWNLAPMPYLTSIMHFVYFGLIITKNKWFLDQLSEKKNPLRWAEYSVTASLMIWIFGQLSGVTNLYLLIMLGVGNVAMQFTGYLYEKEQSKTTSMVLGFFIFVMSWMILWCYFVRTATGAPWFVYAIMIGSNLLFCGFPVVLLLRPVLSPKVYQITFDIVSNVSKLFLDWILFAGILSL